MIVRNSQPRPAPCGMSGLGCSGNCNGCPGRSTLAGGRGLGAFYDSFPAPFNNPLVLAAVAVAVLMIFGGGLKLFGGSGKSGKRRARLSVIKHQAELDRAKLLAS